jgi:hypothetical protein
MNRIMPILLTVLVLVVLVAVPVYRSSAQGPSPVLAASGQKWEYAELLTNDSLDGGQFSFTAPDAANGYVGDRTSEGLYIKLGGTPRTHLPTPSEMQIGLLNQIGSKGWELVTVAPDGVWGGPKTKEADIANYSSLTRVYLFKRPLAK